MTAIPHGDVKIDTRKEPTLSDTKEGATYEQTSKIVYQPHTSHDKAPRDHDHSKPDTWTKALHHHVAWDFGCDIEWEENGQGDVVIQTLHTEINFQLDETRVADIGTIEEAETIDGYQ